MFRLFSAINFSIFLIQVEPLPLFIFCSSVSVPDNILLNSTGSLGTRLAKKIGVWWQVECQSIFKSQMPQAMFTCTGIGFCSVSKLALAQCEQELMFC